MMESTKKRLQVCVSGSGYKWINAHEFAMATVGGKRRVVWLHQDYNDGFQQIEVTVDATGERITLRGRQIEKTYAPLQDARLDEYLSNCWCRGIMKVAVAVGLHKQPNASDLQRAHELQFGYRKDYSGLKQWLTSSAAAREA